MPWLMFAVALGAIVVAFNTFSIGIAAFCLLLALGLSIAGTLSLVSARISTSSQSPSHMLDAKALAGIRQRAAAASATAAESDDDQAAPADPTDGDLQADRGSEVPRPSA